MTNTMLKGFVLGIFVFALALPSAQAEFWGHKGKMSEADHEKFMEEHRQKKEALFKEIGVSDEQLKQIEARREATMEGKKELMQDYMAKKQALGQALDQPQVNHGEVDRIIGELSALYVAKMRRRVDSIIAIKGILTPEQFQALQAKKQEAHGKGFRKFHG